MVGGNENMSKENTAVTKKKLKRCKEDVVFDTACFIILTLVLFVVAYPLYWVIISSISAPSAVSSGKVLLHPIGFTLKGYAEVFKNDQVMRGFLNSLIITFCGVMVNLIVTLPTSYALSRSNFSGKKPITIFYLITMFFGGYITRTGILLMIISEYFITSISCCFSCSAALAAAVVAVWDSLQHDRGKNLLQIEYFGRAV